MFLRSIEDCYKIPASAPTMDKVKKSKSKKLMKLDDMYFFIAETKEITRIYSVNLGIQVLAAYPRSHALNMLIKRLHHIKGLVHEKNS